MTMRIEAITTAVGYPDFLDESIKHNLNQFDAWHIVTSKSDEATREVCRKHDIVPILSEDHEISAGGVNGGTFNKGRLIQRAQGHLSNNAWRVHIDADIILPQQWRRTITQIKLNTQKIYGCDRIMINSWDEWQAAKSSGVLNHTHSQVNMPTGHKLGERWMTVKTGYVPIGFFQMWHSDADEWHGQKIREYPMDHGDACRTDVQFGLQWDRDMRELLPEFLVVHLSSDPNSKLGANWNGRTTPRFGPAPVVCKVKDDGRPCS